MIMIIAIKSDVGYVRLDKSIVPLPLYVWRNSIIDGLTTRSLIMTRIVNY